LQCLQLSARVSTSMPPPLDRTDRPLYGATMIIGRFTFI
jgi:hypothetical protein